MLEQIKKPSQKNWLNKGWNQLSKNKKIVYTALLGVAIAALVISTYWAIRPVSAPPSSVPIGYTPIDSETECQQIEQQVNDLIEKANYCQTDSDCQVISLLTCPFGCYPLLNKQADIAGILQKIEQYKRDCQPLCEYKCAAGPASADIKCLNSKCVDTRFETDQPPMAEVSITVDKTIYSQEEEIIITAKNHLPQSVWYGARCPFLFFNDVDGRWINPPTDCPVQVKKLEPNESIQFYEAAANYQVGKYKVMFDYDLKNPLEEHLLPEDSTRIFSNQFEIKVKAAVDAAECEKDEDCVVSSRKECCFSCIFEAVTKEEAEQRQQWKENNCQDLPCPQTDCPPLAWKAICTNGECKLLERLLKNEGEDCLFDEECYSIDCSKYDIPHLIENFEPYCVDYTCKCMCYGCK